MQVGAGSLKVAPLNKNGNVKIGGYEISSAEMISLHQLIPLVQPEDSLPAADSWGFAGTFGLKTSINFMRRNQPLTGFGLEMRQPGAELHLYKETANQHRKLMRGTR